MCAELLPRSLSPDEGVFRRISTLKSALGSINTALVKHYEQYKLDVKEKVEQLVPWLKRLKDNRTIAAGGIDLEEEERRKELSSSFEESGKRSQALLEKKKVKTLKKS